MQNKIECCLLSFAFSLLSYSCSFFIFILGKKVNYFFYIFIRKVRARKSAILFLASFFYALSIQNKIKWNKIVAQLTRLGTYICLYTSVYIPLAINSRPKAAETIKINELELKNPRIVSQEPRNANREQSPRNNKKSPSNFIIIAFCAANFRAHCLWQFPHSGFLFLFAC